MNPDTILGGKVTTLGRGVQWQDNVDHFQPSSKERLPIPPLPTQNSYVEQFNRTYRDEILNMYVFKTLNEVRELTENWI